MSFGWIFGIVFVVSRPPECSSFRLHSCVSTNVSFAETIMRAFLFIYLNTYSALLIKPIDLFFDKVINFA